ncbi:precorrin-2 dehydrogenase/sirohydrochlorin ferrochelatase family protein, partial [Amycolatopsis kentuckyensis]|uniref:precorrin-2 dehydrogenase/sirohydrochlorin ferrochelatase family protein n=1 Tax=Amycolatopsis kentuckyensis TaxID=218823 RepID=UPI00244AC62B
MDDPHYLSGLQLTGRRVVMIGGGSVAQRRLPRLISAGARVELVSPHTTPSVQGMVDAGELVWHERPYAPGDLRDAWYALACTD